MKKIVLEIDYVNFGCLLSKTVKIISIGKKCAHFATYTCMDRYAKSETNIFQAENQ